MRWRGPSVPQWHDPGASEDARFPLRGPTSSALGRGPRVSALVGGTGGRSSMRAAMQRLDAGAVHIDELADGLHGDDPVLHELAATVDSPPSTLGHPRFED